MVTLRRPPPLVLLSYTALLMTQAFGWIVLIPSFAWQCKVRATEPVPVCKLGAPHRTLPRHTTPKHAVVMPGQPALNSPYVEGEATNDTNEASGAGAASAGETTASPMFPELQPPESLPSLPSDNPLLSPRVITSVLGVALVAAAIPNLHSLKTFHLFTDPYYDRIWRIFLSGGVCASVSHAWAVPLDVIKTRLQTDHERYTGIGDAFVKIIREEGAGMLLKGLGATFIGYSIQGSFKYGFYEIFKGVFARRLPMGSSIFVIWVLASIAADMIGSFALCPLEATRIRLVADPTFAKGTFDGLSLMIKQEGLYSVFKGMPAILAKQVPYTIVQLCGFELLTWLFYSWDVTASLLATPSPWQWLVSFGSAMITGIFASLASQPGDAILSRVNKEKSDKPVLQVMSDSFKEMGIKGLFRGTRARLLHVGMIVTIQLLIYDMVKVAFGLPPTGSH